MRSCLLYTSREEVINHIKDVYGEDHVSQAVSYTHLNTEKKLSDETKAALKEAIAAFKQSFDAAA